MAEIKGKKYEVETRDNGNRRVIQTRRAVYRVAGEPTPEQRKAISRIERGVSDGDWGDTANPYHLMRTAEYMGVELAEEVKGTDGRWRPLPTDDARMELMQTGAL